MIDFGVDFEGEVCEVVVVYVVMVWDVCVQGKCVVIFLGGELMVIVWGQGCGGLNQEYVLVLVVQLKDMLDVVVVVGDMDGVDGGVGYFIDFVGVLIDVVIFVKMKVFGLQLQVYFDNNDVMVFFEVMGDLLQLGLMLINVNDFWVILVD